MTKFELISLFNEFFDGTFSRLADFMTGTFAMVISTFFVGAKLSSRMAKLVVLLYTLFAIATAVPTLAATYRFVQVAHLLKERMTAPDSMIGQIFPAFPSLYVVMPVMSLILVGCYVGALVFFVPDAQGFGAPSNRAELSTSQLLAIFDLGPVSFGSEVLLRVACSHKQLQTVTSAPAK